MGTDSAGKPVLMDIEELLATRLLVQGNSGSGKSHLLRRLLEGSAKVVQQLVIDPEGDFVTLAQRFGHIVVEAGDYNEREIARIAARIREHRASVVLNLESLELESQMRCAAAFLNALFDAPRDHWYPALVVVDEAQMFAPVVAGEVSDEARRASLGAMTNLMCRGRKRGLAGVIATQRLAKLAKNVAAEASNFLMGRTFLDIDMARAADLLGMERRQAEAIRDLERGRFLALGPAICRRPVAVKIGPVETSARSGGHSLLPLPSNEPEDLQGLLFASSGDALPSPPEVRIAPITSEDLIRSIAQPDLSQAASETAAPSPPDENDREAIIREIFQQMAADPDCAYRQAAVLFQDFQVRCRMLRLLGRPVDLPTFRRRFAMAQAGFFDESEERLVAVMAIASTLPEDMLAPFLLIARAALDNLPCPADDVLAESYGTRSQGRVRRLLVYMETQGLIVTRIDFAGKRSIGIPRLGISTAAADMAEAG